MSSEHVKPRFDTVIVRFGGEIGIKASWTRKLYERRLASNIRAMLKQHAIPYEVVNREFGRLYIKTSLAHEASRAIGNVFGVSSVSSAIETTSLLKDITDNSVLAADSMLMKNQTFAVRCRRVGSHSYTSQDVCRRVGQALLDTFADRELRVDLKHPDTTFEVEVRDDLAYVSMETMKGPGGLPLGTQPKLIGLLDDNVNSAVACWMVMKRGCPIIPVHFTETPKKKANDRRMIETAKTLFEWAPGFPRNVYMISHEANIAKINTLSTGKLSNILLKRLTYRIAERLAEKWRAEGIVTGDSLHKPAKEKLHLFRLHDEALAHLPIYRPLIGLEDSEIGEISRRIGLDRKLSDKGKGQRRLPIAAGRISLETVKAAERKLNVEAMVESCLESLRTVSL